MDYKDYYKILGVDKSASEKDIKQAYRKLARKYHPDVNSGDKAIENKFKEINEAYEVLGDKEKRQQYDQLGSYVKGGKIPDDFFSRQSGRPGGFHYNFGGSPGFQGNAQGMGDFSDFFNIFFGAAGPSQGARAGSFSGGINLEDILGGSFGRGHQARPQHQPTSVVIDLSIEEAAFGTTKLLQIEKEMPCGKCKGSGNMNNAICSECSGMGRVRKPSTIEVKIPAGVKSGTKIRVESFILEIRLKSHKFFEMKNGELHCEIPVTVTEAVLGAEIEIPTLKGIITTHIPPETQNGKTLRLSGLGFPEKDGRQGNLYARIRVIIPGGLSSKEKQLYKDLSHIKRDNPRDAILKRQWS